MKDSVSPTQVIEQGATGVGTARADSTREVASRRAFWTVLGATTLVRIVVANFAPLSGDEAYIWDCSRHLDWSYVDLPPLLVWSAIPFRLLLGETALAVRMPTILASLAIGLCLVPLARRLGGGIRDAMRAYLWLCCMPIFLLGSIYASTDAYMSAFFVATTWAAVALAQGDLRAWWGLAVLAALAFLAKFPGVLALAAIVPTLFSPDVRRSLASPTPWLAALLAVALTAPVWIWGAQHDWVNLTFQLRQRHQVDGAGARHVVSFLALNLVLATPALFIAIVAAWWRGMRRRVLAWQVVAVATAAPFVTFGLVALATRVGAHWGAPGLVLGALMLALTPALRPRRALAIVSATLGVPISAVAALTVLYPAVAFRFAGDGSVLPERLRTEVVNEVLSNRDVIAALDRVRRPGELVAADSYHVTHLFTFLSNGHLPIVLGDVDGGEHGIGSLYWHAPAQLRGRDVLFATEQASFDARRLARYFQRIEALPPIRVHRDGRLIREFRLFRCTGLRQPSPAFSRLGAGQLPPRSIPASCCSLPPRPAVSRGAPSEYPAARRVGRDGELILKRASAHVFYRLLRRPREQRNDPRRDGVPVRRPLPRHCCSVRPCGVSRR
jgi:hypothetical protein